MLYLGAFGDAIDTQKIYTNHEKIPDVNGNKKPAKLGELLKYGVGFSDAEVAVFVTYLGYLDTSQLR